MTSRTVKSAAGDTIQITSDEDWADAIGVTTTSLRQWMNPNGFPGLKARIFRALWEHGEFTNSSGRVGQEVVDYIDARWPDTDMPTRAAGIMGTFRNPVNYPAVTSQMNGKRTYSLKLVALPETWYRKLMADINGDKPAEVTNFVPEPSPADRQAAELMEKVIIPQEVNGEEFSDADWEAIQLDAPTVYEEPPPLELHIANQVAMSLLTTVVEIISAGTADTSGLMLPKQLGQELEQAQHLLSQRLMENDKLRRQLREAGDTIGALRQERDGLRSRLRMTEHNLSEVLKGETAQAVNSEIQKRVDQIMRTAPTAKGS